ncbi:caspase recruitment domain-containing protein 19 isoform X3 [Bombina bombina]|uniref:caspase recruitment domain-containing protein 19 isoform X3 n=1 Tax=Bombina bombina TaxID=8345 RepID=UPI00235A842F|nr:caspase recruitment domain-containing protein 19 isoform X3 [Bombina bombina]
MLPVSRKYHLYYDRLTQDAPFLTQNGRLSERLVDKIILQLNRVYPQVLSNKEAEKFRNPKLPLRTRLSDLLKHLQQKGDSECQQFYRALQNNADKLYTALPSRKNMRPVFFLTCFSVAAGLAYLMYYSNPEEKSIGAAKKVLGFTAIGFSRHIKRFLISYLEDSSTKY